MHSDALIIFARPPVAGQVKTRLAAGIGKAGALTVYRRLLNHTRAVAEAIAPDKHVFLTGRDTENFWLPFARHLQAGGDLGDRMAAAFGQLFAAGYEKLVIIGSDCPGLNAALLSSAFEALNDTDVVLGPATDGGYYLLGMRRLYPDLFRDKSWSSDQVLSETLSTARARNLSYTLLPTLTDVDAAADLPEGWWPEEITP